MAAFMWDVRELFLRYEARAAFCVVLYAPILVDDENEQALIA